MRRLLFILLFSVSGFSFGADYYWKAGDANGAAPFYTGNSFLSAAQAYFAATCTGACVIKTGPTCSKVSDVIYNCQIDAKSPSYPNGGYIRGSKVSRFGDSCPAGSTYDSATGACKFPFANAGDKCGEADSTGLVKIYNNDGGCVPMLDADQSSQCKYLSKQGTRAVPFYVSFSQDGNPQSPPSPEMFGCEVRITSVANCKMPAASSSGGITLAPAQVARCKVAAFFTGNVAGTGKMTVANPAAGTDGQCGDSQDCTPPDQPTVTESQPCNYVLDGEGRKVCSASQFKGDPGNMDCGSVNGAFTCITKPAKSTGTKTDTTVETKANADGTTTTTKSDTIVQTTCTGAGSCTSTTTKVSNVTKTDGSGNTTSTSGTCTGSKCATATNPDGNGDGLGDCTGSDCGEGGPSVGSLTDPTAGSFDGMEEEWDQKIAQAKDDFVDKLDQLKSAFNPIGDVSLSSGGDLFCPEAPTVLGAKFDACVSVYDEQLSWLSLAILLVCACIALCIVFV